MMGDWSNLPRDIIGLIFGRLQFLSDIQRFMFVCHLWRSVALETCHPFDPMLIISYDEDAENCNFYSLVDKKVYKLHLPELNNKRCCGTSNGWLLTVDDDTVLRLLHPFSKAEISLPPFVPLSPCSASLRQDIFEGYEETGAWKSFVVQKIILSSSPLNPECIFISFGGRGSRISFCKATDETWTTLNIPGNGFYDALYFEGRIYAGRTSIPVVFDVNYNVVDAIEDAVDWSRFKQLTRFGYFVESCGDLLYVTRFIKYFRVGGNINIEQINSDEDSDEDGDRDGGDENELTHQTVLLMLFKFTWFDESDEVPWERVTCLGDRALFIGCNQSFSLSVTEYPTYKANHIYFTNDSDGAFEHHDSGEFNMENGSITFYDLDAHYHKKQGQPMWYFKQL